MYYTKDEKNAYFHLTTQEKELKERIGEDQWIKLMQKSCQLAKATLVLIDVETEKEITLESKK